MVNARRVIVNWCSKMPWVDEDTHSITLFVLRYAQLPMFFRATAVNLSPYVHMVRRRLRKIVLTEKIRRVRKNNTVN